MLSPLPKVRSLERVSAENVTLFVSPRPRLVRVRAALVTAIAPPTLRLVTAVTTPVEVSVPPTTALDRAVTTPVDVKVPDEAMLLKATLLVVPSPIAVLKLVTSVLVRAGRPRPRLVRVAAILLDVLVPENWMGST